MLKFWAFIYRKTGWFCPLVYKYQFEYLMSKMTHIASEYSEYEVTDLSLESYIKLTIGLWQCRHGFYRSYNWEKSMQPETYEQDWCRDCGDDCDCEED